MSVKAKEGKGRLVRALAVTSLLMTSSAAYAVSIFEVRKRLPMTNDEQTHRDFYLNGGVESGLKSGMIVRVTRQVTLYDSYQNKSPGDLVVPVGELKVIFAQKGVSVARLYRVYDRSDLPILEEDFIMVGDEVDVGSARMDKGSSKQKSSSHNMGPPSPEPAKIESATSASVAPNPEQQNPKPTPEVGTGTYLP
ncbi:MAG: hypothetical protein H6624_11045 [Bdellovibrionaceae bacterium]|nr:hypothetical protein [Pseudobdellovibrionaceae bacterium]